MKPKYKVPTMDEVRALDWNGHTVVSTFSGAGGSCLGYRMAGYRVLWASEFVPAAADVYRANKAAGSHLDTRDIREVQPQDILSETGLERGQLDIFDGSPPCASFSLSGNREKNWGEVKKYSDTKQRTDDLFAEYVRLLDGLQPKVFVAENVTALAQGKAKGVFLEVMSLLRSAGYRVKCRELHSRWLGVPQSRQRLIFLGVREDLGSDPYYPDPVPQTYTLWDAIGDLEDQPAEPESSLEKYSTGREWHRLKKGEQSTRYFNLRRCHEDQPCPTILASHGSPGSASPAHPRYPRKFSIAELKRVCAFPDDFILSGPYIKQYERLGRAVPPVMMKHIASAVLTNLER